MLEVAPSFYHGLSVAQTRMAREETGSVDVTKAELRSRIRSRRRERRSMTGRTSIDVSPASESQLLRSHWETACLYFGLAPYSASTLPALFMPLPTEPDVSGIVERAPRCLLPVLFDEAGAPLSTPSWGLHVAGEDDWVVCDARWPAQPRTPVATSMWEEVSIVLAPALAVDRGGARVGQGGGWYDRALATLPDAVPVVAAVFDDEIIEAGVIPLEPHDYFIDGVICPGGFFPTDV